MKVTIQRTSKPAKLLILFGGLWMMFAVYGLMTGAVWWLAAFVVGFAIWFIGKVSAWFFNG